MKKTTYIIIIYIAVTLLVSAFAFPVFYGSLDKKVTKRYEHVDLTVDLGGATRAVALPGVTRLEMTDLNSSNVNCVFIQSDTVSAVTILAPKGLYENMAINTEGDSTSVAVDLHSARHAYDKTHPVTDIVPGVVLVDESDSWSQYNLPGRPGRSAFMRYYEYTFTSRSNALVVIVPAGLSVEASIPYSEVVIAGFNGNLPSITNAYQVNLVNCRSLDNLRIYDVNKVFCTDNASIDCSPEAILADGACDLINL